MNKILRLLICAVCNLFCSGSITAQDTTMYRGGDYDGNDLQDYSSFVPEQLNHWSIYAGGYADGNSLMVLNAFVPNALMQQAIYSGGYNGGNALVSLDQFIPADLSHQFVYTGALGDGAAVQQSAEFNMGMLNHYVAYSSSSIGDGAAVSLSLSFDPLPVNLIEFTGVIQDNRFSRLQWVVEKEQDARAYELLRSDDGRHFRSIVNLPVKTPQDGRVLHYYDDHMPLNGANYYQLKIIETDGKEYLSNIVLLWYKDGHQQVAVYPNPAVQSVTVQYETKTLHTISLVAYNGKRLWSKQVDDVGNSTTIPLEEYVDGIYVVELQFKSGERSAVKLVKRSN